MRSGTRAARSRLLLPIDVMEQLLGHASLQTTSVYVTAEQKRRRRELAKGAEHQLAVAREESRIGRTFALRLAHHGPLE